jgi:hypothetical protein
MRHPVPAVVAGELEGPGLAATIDQASIRPKGDGSRFISGRCEGIAPTIGADPSDGIPMAGQVPSHLSGTIAATENQGIVFLGHRFSRSSRE